MFIASVSLRLLVSFAYRVYHHLLMLWRCSFKSLHRSCWHRRVELVRVCAFLPPSSSYLHSTCGHPSSLYPISRMCIHFCLVLSLLAFLHMYSTTIFWFTLALPISDPFSVLLHRSFIVCCFIVVHSWSARRD